MKYASILKSRLDSGSSLEEAITHLRIIGASPRDVMKALIETRKVNLGEAKLILQNSKAWKDITVKAEKLRGKVVKTIRNASNKPL
jgi:hypothetical protein